MSPREWDAQSYDALPLPHVEWGKRTIARLNLTGTERVLDAGCGTGRDALELLTQFPDVDLVGIDGSAHMIDEANARVAERAVFVQGDLTQSLSSLESLGRGGKFDAVMSVACFHWINDHRALFSNLADVLRPGGKLVTDSGGQGNISNVEIAIAKVEGVSHLAKAFVSPEETRANLTASGFMVNSVELRPHPLRIDDPAVMTEYLRTVCLGGYLEHMTPSEGAEFVEAVRVAMPEPVFDYVRLEIDAVRS